MNALLELFRHKTWATLRLIEHCKGLGDEHLDATTPGTYGTIRDTLRHLVDSEEGYFWTLTHERVSKALPEGPAPMDELAEHIRRLGPRWEIVARDLELPGRDFSTQDGWLIKGVVPMTQAIHHADDHRSHVLSILGARDLPVPELDVWGYAESVGLMQVDPAKKFSATVHTTRGDFVIALGDAAIAAEAVNRFVYLAQNQFYDGLTFYGVVPGVVVHGGDPPTSGADGPGYQLPGASNPPRCPRGTVGMGSSPSGVRSQFFIALGDAPSAGTDEAYKILGRVSSGIEVVEKIQVGDTISSLEITASA